MSPVQKATPVWSVPPVFRTPTTCVFGYVWSESRGHHVPCQLPYGHGGECGLLPEKAQGTVP